MDTTDVPPSGRAIHVPAGGDFQAALNAARPGDVITLEAGAMFTGPFTLPRKQGSGWISVRTSAPDSQLPPPGARVDPSFARVMPKLVAASGAVLKTAPRAHHYRFIGIEIHPTPGTFLYNLVELGVEVRPRVSRFPFTLFGLGASEDPTDQIPHHIIFDRCYLHGDPKKGARRGIALNSAYTAVIDSYLADFKEAGADSQAIAGWNGPGPFKIVNNYLEAAGENLMFGGADPSIPNLVPSDIEIRRNHFFKPLSWRVGDPAYAGTAWTVKNLFELKNARRVLVDGNLFEHNWVASQNGFAILFTVRNQDGTAPWSAVEDVTFTNNVVRHSARGMNIHGFDDSFPSQQTRRILTRNNLFEDIVAARWGGGCCAGLFQIGSATADVVVDHNTAIHADSVITADGAPNTGFVYTNNLTPHNEYGIAGSGTGTGRPTLERYFPQAIVSRNVLVGGLPRLYPPENFFPRSLEEVGFVDRAQGDYRLASSSPYRRAGTDGNDPGVDHHQLSAAMGNTPPSRGPALPLPPHRRK
ncbi:MAG: hypothetical protein HYX77_00490 [Acidobacteria bacterium]|nr:hypothetical protein [Acidobacteriota bacterium]